MLVAVDRMKRGTGSADLTLSPTQIIGDVLALDITSLDRQSELIAINEQTDHDIMHLSGFGEADGFAHQAFNSGTQN